MADPKQKNADNILSATRYVPLSDSITLHQEEAAPPADKRVEVVDSKVQSNDLLAVVIQHPSEEHIADFILPPPAQKIGPNKKNSPVKAFPATFGGYSKSQQPPEARGLNITPLAKRSASQPAEEDEFDWFNVEGDAAPEEEEHEYVAQGLFGLNCCYIPGYARFFVYLLSGLALFATPTIASLILWRTEDPGLFDTVTSKSDLRVSTEVARWSCWFGCSWISWVTMWYFFDALPYLAVQFLNTVFGGYSERTRARLEYFVAMKLFLTITTWAILTFVCFALLFHDMANVDYWLVIFHVIATVLVFTICLLVQKFVLQIIAVNFHRVAYLDRITVSKRHMAILDDLKKSIRSRVSDPATSLDDQVSSPSIPHIEESPSNPGNLDSPSVKENARPLRRFFWSSKAWHRKGKTHETNGHASEHTYGNELHEIRISGTSVRNANKSDETTIDPRNEVFKTGPLARSELPEPFSLRDVGGQDGSAPNSRRSSIAPRSIRIKSPPRSPQLHPLDFSDGIHCSRAHSRRSTNHPPHTKASHDKGSHHPEHNDHLDSPITNDLSTIISAPTFHGHRYLRELARMDITSDIQAGKLAKKIFTGLGGNDKGFLTQEDLLRAFTDRDEAKEAFTALDQDGNGSITRKEVKEVVIGMYRERRRLFRAMRDLSQALGKLNIFFYFLTGFVTFCIALPIFGISLSAMLPFTSFILALSFVFGTAARTAFESLLFLFLNHPYDAGDRVLIDNQNMLVREVGVLTTVFKRLDGQLIYAPNTLVATKLIHNLRRSGDQSESIELHLNFDTPEEKLKILHERMLEYVKSEPREFQNVCDIHCADMENLSKLKVNVILKHKGNWQDCSKRWSRRSMFMLKLRDNLNDLGIKDATSAPTKSVSLPAQPQGTLQSAKESLNVQQTFAAGMHLQAV
ncbi:Mechanosensitive ion channel-domain-containing protein [Phlyctochytrium arcticum]|nr:Mechanosensitive ion channel-domain-containing protein [Phlyctochytrium arcticum]